MTSKAERIAEAARGVMAWALLSAQRHDTRPQFQALSAVHTWTDEQVRAVARQAWARGAVVAGQMSPEGTSRPDDVQLREWLDQGDDSWIAERHPGMTEADAIAAIITATRGGARS